MAGKDISVKKYVVRLSPEERGRLEEFTRKGRPAAHLVTRARIFSSCWVTWACAGAATENDMIRFSGD